MKIRTPIFILGLLVFVTPIIGLPQFYEQIILAAYGLTIMILVSIPVVFASLKHKTKIEPEIKNEKEEGLEIE